MIDHVWTVLCSHAVIDRDSNNVSLLDVIEQLNIRDRSSSEKSIVFSLDPMTLSLDLMTLWARSDIDVPAQGRGRVTFLSPSGEVSDGPFEFGVDLSQHRRIRTRGSFKALHVTEPGRYLFRVELQNEGETEWCQVAMIPLEINILPPDETEQTETESE